MKYLIIGLIFLSFNNCIAQNQISMNTIHKYKVEDINGEEFNFSDLKGKKILIVNTASKCGYTPQFSDLEALYQKYKNENFVIVGFPSNDFGQQDPGSNEEIAAFCQINYGVSFPMMSKITVIGEQKNPVYKFLTEKELNGKVSSTVKWNFQKYLINEDGTLEDFFYSDVKPNDERIINWLASGSKL